MHWGRGGGGKAIFAELKGYPERSLDLESHKLLQTCRAGAQSRGAHMTEQCHSCVIQHVTQCFPTSLEWGGGGS